MGAPENTAKQNQTDETGEAKLNIIYTRQEAIKIKCKLDKTGKPMEAEHREMRQRTRDTTGETEARTLEKKHGDKTRTDWTQKGK